MADEPNPDTTTPATKPPRSRATDDEPAAVFKTPERWARERAKLQAEGADELIEKLGFSTFDDLKAAVGTGKEAPKLRKALDELTAKHADVADRYRKVVRRDAVMKFATKFSDADTAAEIIAARLTVKDDGTVEAPDGKAVEAFVDEILEAKPILRASSHKAGAGTSAKAPKVDSPPAGAHKPPNGEGDKKPSLAELALKYHTGDLPIPGAS